MLMRIFATPTIIATLFLSLIGCTQDKPNTTNNKPKTTTQEISKADSTLLTHVALTDIPYPPFEMRSEDSEIIGMEIEIFNAIAKDQKFNIEYAPHTWEGIFDKMNNGEAKFVVSAVTITNEAKEKALLSEPYYFSPYRVVSLNKAKLDKWENQKIGISASEDLADELPKLGIKANNLTTYTTVFMALSGLIRGEVDVVVADSTVLL